MVATPATPAMMAIWDSPVGPAAPAPLPISQPGASITGAQRAAEAMLAIWKRRWLMAIMPATSGTVERIGPRKRPKNTAAKP
ncbi:hypothetical protein A6302_00080 [Methylobrevis pamukkalensis]|uniref:Uncharacterized protein n=1 Tax=Methylobrevis pamukkalensis TaxID=1439726 RepID=A0A1E3H8D0_9HYPH|nr:hypothetical protein A6302_00080 [Methylobrevis pamukkalensis]